MNQVAENWKDYECIDAGNGEKLERWKDVILRRPDPIALWPIDPSDAAWEHPHAHYHRSNKGGGHWEYKERIPESWTIRYRNLRFKVSPTGFKHTGLFPEQAANWDFLMDQIEQAHREIRVLNLFAYTAERRWPVAAAGAKEVVHVDAAKAWMQWAKENMVLSHLEDRKIRFIVDDVLKFVERRSAEDAPTMVSSWIRQAMAGVRKARSGRSRNSSIRSYPPAWTSWMNSPSSF